MPSLSPANAWTIEAIDVVSGFGEDVRHGSSDRVASSMRKQYRAALREVFEREFAARHSEFVRLKPVRPFYSQDELILCAQRPDGAAHFVIVSPHPSGHEAFTVEVGWSRSGDLPKLTMRPTPGNPRKSVDRQGQVITRLAYVDETIPEFWYIERNPIGLSGEEILAQIANAAKPLTMELAIDRVAQSSEAALDAVWRVGLPFLAQHWDSRGS
jgi:hypothetical protein